MAWILHLFHKRNNRIICFVLVIAGTELNLVMTGTEKCDKYHQNTLEDAALSPVFTEAT